jgi:hypothetical protein
MEETNGMVESQNRHFSRNSLICPTFKIASVKKNIMVCPSRRMKEQTLVGFQESLRLLSTFL